MNSRVDGRIAVERPLIKQLERMGYEHIRGDVASPMWPSGRVLARCCYFLRHGSAVDTAGT